VKNFHVVRWSGVVSYRKLKVTIEKKKELCPICRHELVKARYFGRDPTILAWLSSTVESVPHGKDRKLLFAPFRENGVVVWVEDVHSKKKWGE